MLEASENATNAISIIRELARSRIIIDATERVIPPNIVEHIHNIINNQTTTTIVTIVTTSMLGSVTPIMNVEEPAISDVIDPRLTIKGQEDYEGSQP